MTEATTLLTRADIVAGWILLHSISAGGVVRSGSARQSSPTLSG